MALLEACKEMRDTCTEAELGVIALVRELGKLLCQLPVMHDRTDSGKLYERIILQAMICRAATSRSSTLTVRELLGYPPPTTHQGVNINEKLLSTEVIRPTAESLRKVAIEAFPLASNKNEKETVNVPCSRMPAKSKVPWYTDANALHKYNCVVDSMLCLKVAGKTDKHSVTIGFQSKEHKEANAAVDAFRSRACLQPYGRNTQKHGTNIESHLHTRSRDAQHSSNVSGRSPWGEEAVGPYLRVRQALKL